MDDLYHVDELDQFETYINNLEEQGLINSDFYEDETAFKTVSDKFMLDNKENVGVTTAIKSLPDSDINTISDLQLQQSSVKNSFAAADSQWAISQSVDTAQKMFGEAFQTIGDATGFDSLKNWGKEVVKQQEKDIADGNYISTYKGSFSDQKGVDMLGWIVEGILENSASTVGIIGGTIAAVAVAPVSAVGAATITGATATSAALMGIGEVTEELKNKNVYSEDKAAQAIAIGLISSAVDLWGAGKLAKPVKDALIRKAIVTGVSTKIAKEVSSSGIVGTLKAGGAGFLSEGLTETLQEGLIIANAISEGAEYDDGEIADRFIDSFIIGGAMGGTVGATTSTVNNAITTIKEKGGNADIASIKNAVDEQQVSSARSQSVFTGGGISGLSPSQTSSLAANTEHTESRGDQEVINRYGYAGLYQFGASALNTVGLMKRKPKGIHQRDWMADEKNWNIDGGLNGFLKSKEIQDKAFVDLANANIKTGIKLGAIDGKDIGDIGAFVKAAHLVGAGGASKLFNDNSDSADANGTKASKYATDGREAVSGETQVRRTMRGDKNRIRTVTDQSNNKREFNYKVVEAGTLNDEIDLATNGFKDKSRDDYINGAGLISDNLDYGYVSSSPITETGAPVISADGSIIDGSTRLLGVQDAYNNGGADQYKASLIEDADVLGLDLSVINSMDNPILVRQLVDDVPASDTALAPSGVDDNTVFSSEEILESSRDETSTKLFDKILEESSPSEQSKMVDSDGKISPYGQQTLDAEIIKSTYGKPLDTDNQKISDALINASPLMAAINKEVNDGTVYATDISESIYDAIKNGSSAPSSAISDAVSNSENDPNAIKEFLTTYLDNLKTYGSPAKESVLTDNNPTVDDVMQGGNGGKGGGIGIINNVAEPDDGGDGNAQISGNVFDKRAESASIAEDPQTVAEKFSQFFKRNFRSTASTISPQAQNISERAQSRIGGENTKTVTGIREAELRFAVKDLYSKDGIPDTHLEGFSEILSGGQVSPELMGDGKFAQMVFMADGMRSDVDSRSNKVVDLILDELNKNYGGNAAATVADAVALRDKIISDAKSMNAPLTPEQRRVVQQVGIAETINGNIGSHLHRSYAIHRTPTWEKNILTSNQPEFQQRRAKALEFFIARVDSENKQRDASSKLSDEDIDKVAHQRMVDFIRNNGVDREAGNFFGGKAYDGSLRKRQELLDNTPALRGLLGEYVDPLVKYKHSIETLERMIGQREFFKDFSTLAQQEGIEIAEHGDQHGRLQKIGVNDDSFLTNPFAGKYAEPHVKDFIEKTTNDMDTSYELAVKTNSIWQAAHTVYSVPTTVANITSIIPVILSTASLSKRGALDSFHVLGQVFGERTHSDEVSKDFTKKYGFDIDHILNYMSENQISHGGAVGGEASAYLGEAGDSWIGKNFDRAFTNEFEGTGVESGKLKSRVNKIGDAGITTKEAFEKAYNFGDSLPKTVIFLNELRRLNEVRKKDPSLVDATTMLDSAATMAKQQAPQYSRIPKVIELIRKFPTHGQFVAFKAQLYQTVANQARMNIALMFPERNVKFIKDYMGVDINNASTPETREIAVSDLRKRGAVKTAAMISTISGFGTILNLGISAIKTDGDEPENLDDINNLMPDYYRFNSKQYIGTDKSGVMEFVNTARMNMYGDLGVSLKIPQLYASGKITSAGEAAKLFADSLVSPFYDTTFVSKLVVAATKNQDSFNRAIITDEDGIMGNAGNVMSYFMRELVENGTTKAIGEAFSDMVSDDAVDKRTGRELSTVNASLYAGGVSTIKFDANKQVMFWFHKLDRRAKELRGRLSGKLKSYSVIDDDAINSIVVSSRDEHNRIYEEIISKISSARNIGLSDFEIRSAIKLSGSSAKAFDTYLSNGRIPPFMMGGIGTRQLKASDFKNISDSAKINFQRNYEKAREAINNL